MLRRWSGGAKGCGLKGMCIPRYCRGGVRCESAGCCVSVFSVFFNGGGDFVDEFGECSVGFFSGGSRTGLDDMGGGVSGRLRQIFVFCG